MLSGAGEKDLESPQVFEGLLSPTRPISATLCLTPQTDWWEVAVLVVTSYRTALILCKMFSQP